VDEYWAATRWPSFVRAMRLLLHAFEWAPGRAEELQRLRARVLVVFGTLDRFVRPRSAEKYVACAPDARLSLVNDAGHVLPEEVPAEVNRAVVEFARGLDDAPGAPGDTAAGTDAAAARAVRM
jgi:pimeloyl-ACP methyl ester carboxylesterase